jgi:hypothetical protein
VSAVSVTVNFIPLHSADAVVGEIQRCARGLNKM